MVGLCPAACKTGSVWHASDSARAPAGGGTPVARRDRTVARCRVVSVGCPVTRWQVGCAHGGGAHVKMAPGPASSCGLNRLAAAAQRDRCTECACGASIAWSMMLRSPRLTALARGSPLPFCSQNRTLPTRYRCYRHLSDWHRTHDSVRSARWVRQRCPERSRGRRWTRRGLLAVVRKRGSPYVDQPNPGVLL